MTLTRGTLVNRRAVPTSDLSTLEDLLNPKFKGRIAIYEPREANNGSLQLAAIMVQKGEDFVRQLLQDAVFVDSPSQLVDFVSAGRYPIGIGDEAQRLEQLKAEGLARDVEVTNLSANGAATGIAVMRNAPHPAAAKLLVNWFLTQQGQEAFAREGKTVSRRSDVPPYADTPSRSAPEWGRLDQYARGNEWQGIAMVERVNELAKAVKR
jgi:iron(III) transport system substrate-binding protein